MRTKLLVFLIIFLSSVVVYLLGQLYEARQIAMAQGASAREGYELSRNLQDVYAYVASCAPQCGVDTANHVLGARYYVRRSPNGQTLLIGKVEVKVVGGAATSLHPIGE